MVRKSKFTARPTVYKGIQMRSRLEAGFAAWLDGEGIDWEYEPSAFGSERGQYLPDFELLSVLVKKYFPGRQDRRVFVEIKPSRPTDELLSSLAGILWESEPRAYLVAIWPEGACWGLRLLTPPHHFRAEGPFGSQGTAEDAVWIADVPHLDGSGKRWHDRVVHTIDVPVETPWPDGYWKPKGGD